MQTAREQSQIGQPAPAGKQQAIAIIRQVINGQIPQLPAAVDPDFIAYFDQFLASSDAQGLDDNSKTVLQQMRDQAAQLTSGVLASPSMMNADSSQDMPIGISWDREGTSSPWDVKHECRIEKERRCVYINTSTEDVKTTAEQTTAPESSTEEQTTAEQTVDESTQASEEQKTVPYERFKEVNEKVKTITQLEAKIAELRNELSLRRKW